MIEDKAFLEAINALKAEVPMDDLFSALGGIKKR